MGSNDKAEIAEMEVKIRPPRCGPVWELIHGAGGEYTAAMELHPDTTADEPCELAPADEAPSQSFALGGFQGIPWTWWEIVLGLAPLVAVKIVVVPRAYSWLGVVGILAVAMGLYGWILFFPLAMARRRHRPVMQPTTFG